VDAERIRPTKESAVLVCGGHFAPIALATQRALHDLVFPPPQTTFCDSTLRISRGVPRFPSAPAELRVFAREVQEDQWGSWQEEEDAKTQASTSTAAEVQSEEPAANDPYESYFDEMPD